MVQPPKELTKGWGKLRPWLNDLRRFAIESCLVESHDIDLHQTPAGQVPFVRHVSASGGDVLRFDPYYLHIRENPASPGNWQGGIEYWSGLFDSMQPDDKKTITGLLAADMSSGWFDLLANDAVWLEIQFSGSAFASAAIKSWGEGDSFNIDEPAWSGNDGYCEDDGETPPIHETSRILLAYTIAGASGEPVPWQLVKSHLLLTDLIVDARPARYPVPHPGGYLH